MVQNPTSPDMLNKDLVEDYERKARDRGRGKTLQFMRKTFLKRCTIMLPSGNLLQFAIENGNLYIVSFPINSMVIFHSYLDVYQRVFCYAIQYTLYFGVLGVAEFTPGDMSSCFFDVNWDSSLWLV